MGKMLRKSPPARKTMARLATQNVGSEYKMNRMTVEIRSHREYRWVAEKIPTGTAMKYARKMAMTSSRRVFARDSSISSPTGRFFEKDSPRFKVASFAHQVTYLPGLGL